MTASAAPSAKHPQPTLDTLRDIVARAVGSRPTAMKRQGGGLSSLAFQIEAAGEAFVMRVGEGSEKLAGFEREYLAARLAQTAGVPTQDIVAVGNAGFWAYTIALKVRGKPATDHPKRMHVLEELGWLANRVHTIPTAGYGENFSAAASAPAHDNGVRSWREFLYDEWDASGRIQRLTDYDLLSPRQQSRVAAILADVATWNSLPVLNHGDLRLKNVMVDDDARVTGLIDWETATSGIGPHWDMSVALHDLSIDAKEAFVRGYGMSARDLHEWSDVWRMFNVLNYSKRVEHLVQRGDWRAIDDLRTRLSGALDLYL